MITQKVVSGSRNNIGEVIPHIVQTACTFKSAISFVVGDKHVNAKSIMGVMALASQNLDVIDVCVEGEDEAEAFKAIAELLS